MSFLPVKNNDVVIYEGQRYIVAGTSLTNDGPIVEIYPIGTESLTVHVSEIELENKAQRKHRRKTVPLSQAELDKENKKARLADIMAEAKTLIKELGG